MTGESPHDDRFNDRFTDWVTLAEGAEGRLYRVTDRWSGRVSALKIGADASAVEAMREEFRLLSRFRHPCLIESRDLVREGDEVAHLLEYVPAVAPGALWEQGGEAVVWAALTQALRGLDYLHRHATVHGDIAPGNILVWPEGERWRAKVADFGLAQSQAEASRSGPRGTPGYMAPENVRGEGFGPAADLYSLAATAVSWIDGRGPWDDVGPADALRRVASGADVPAPRRRVSAELAGVIAALGRGVAADRRAPEWPELRARKETWGDPVLMPGVFGLEEPLDEWGEWVNRLPMGRVGAVTVRGRMGTGRSTVCRMMARRLVAEGWTALWDLPLEAVRDWLEETAGDPDPVRLARELGRRFAERDVVVVWPERVGELESRLLRALVVGREQEGSERRTCVMKVTPLVDADDDSRWLESAVRVRATDWLGPSEAGLRVLRDDLFPPEDGYDDEEKRPAIEAGSSPLAAIALKRRRAEGEEESAAIEGEEAVRREVDRVWGDAGNAVRSALTILAWSERGWDPASLAAVMGWDAGTAGSVEDALGRLALTRRDYDQGVLQERITDWLVRAAVRERKDARLESRVARQVADRLDAEATLHPHDLELAVFLLDLGALPRMYTQRALDRALQRGRYESILRLWEAAREGGGSTVGELGFVWEAALRATQKLGRFHEEVTILRALLAEGPEGEMAVERRKMLSHALFAASDWQGAVAECERVIAARGESSEDGLWARIQKAEFLWQTGRFDEARSVYDAVGGELEDNEELFLKYAIGRARMSGQVSDVGAMEGFARAVEEKVSKDLYDEEPLYFHVKAGLAIKAGNQVAAEPLIARSLALAESRGRWKEQVMIASRAGSIAYELGKIRDARQMGTSAISTALALRSDWMEVMASLYVGYFEVYLGDFDSAARRYSYALSKAQELDDLALKIQGNRLKAFVSAHCGDDDSLNESTRFLEGDKSNRQASVFALECRAAHAFAQEDWCSAEDWFRRALSGLQESGEIDEMAAIGAKLGYVWLRLNDLEQARTYFGDAWEFFCEGKYPKMRPIAQIIGSLVFPHQIEFALRDPVQELQRQGRVTDLALWGAEILRLCPKEDLLGFRKVVLAALQTISNNFQDKLLRRRFLEIPRIRSLLLDLRQQKQ